MEPLNLYGVMPPTVKLRSKKNAPASMPRWYESSPNALLAEDCRAKCGECHGHGSHAGAELETCASCQTNEMPCALHRCKACAGSGLVCPACRGMRFVRVAEWDVRRGTVVEIERCRACCEGNNVNPAIERRAITRYMTRWLAQHPHDTPEAYAEREAARHAEAAERYAEWQEMNAVTTTTHKKRPKLAPLPKFRDWGEPS